MDKVRVPPIKCQGIKTKIVPLIAASVEADKNGTWIEPFLGSGVVGFNVAPRKALFGDLNPNIINFYNALKSNEITPQNARLFLKYEGEKLKSKGSEHYYEVRERFNNEKNPLDFLFLSRACFNGMIRFNKSGRFNVPFCKKDDRFSKSYITKIINQLTYVWKECRNNDWNFICAPFKETIMRAGVGDIIYCDPPYYGRHTDYYDSWAEQDEKELSSLLSATQARFILSSWLKNKFRINPMIETYWNNYNFITKNHFYHVGGKEKNRNEIVEMLIMNFIPNKQEKNIEQKNNYGDFFDALV